MRAISEREANTDMRAATSFRKLHNKIGAIWRGGEQQGAAWSLEGYRERQLRLEHRGRATRFNSIQLNSTQFRQCQKKR